MNKHILRVTLPVCLVILLSSAWLADAGNLNPPAGPVTSTMKTLSEVEPRIPINVLGTISASGSYYLTQDLEAAFCGGHGILIDADNVTLDLNGFTLSHQFNCSLDGISLNGNRSNITIRNGTVRGFTQDGVNLSTGINCIVTDVKAYQNGGKGITSGEGSTVTRCTAAENGGFGIEVGFGSTISDCASRLNLNVGFLVNESSVISNCAAKGNAANGFHVVDSTITGCIAADTTGNGILLSQGLVSNCTSHDNTGDGIEAFNALVRGNSCYANGGLPIFNSVGSSTLIENHAVP